MGTKSLAEQEKEERQGSIRRRGLIAGAAALAAGLITARAGDTPVDAASGTGPDDSLVLGSDGGTFTANTTAHTTVVRALAAMPDNSTILDLQSLTSAHNITGLSATAQGNAPGVTAQGGFGGGIGVKGVGGGVVGATSGSGSGLLGIGGPGGSGTPLSGFGVVGLTAELTAPRVATASGVYGETSTGFAGVEGVATDTYGVLGNAFRGIGVYGSSQTQYGVYGTCVSATTSSIGSTAGVYGFGGAPANAIGVYGSSDTGYGVVGKTSATGYSGLTGITSVAGGAAFAGTSTVPGAYATYFQGPTVVQGDFTAFGGTKSAAVPAADGTHRVVYCVEAPESWFEDFGKAKLVNGNAAVNLDPIFMSVVHNDDYHVFLTAYGNTNGLHVTNQTASGFTVQEHNGGANSLSFSWRIVAKRKDIKGERLAKFELPKIKFPDPKAFPPPPKPPVQH